MLTPSLFFFDGVSRLYPRRHPAFEGFDIPVPHSDVSGRLTGGASLPGSGSVEDNFLVFAQSGKSGLKFPEGNRSLQLYLFEPAIIFVGAD
jgi:hypothetical protein